MAYPWEKYRMALLPRYKSDNELIQVVVAHMLVTNYLDRHEEARKEWLAGDHKYFDILDKAEAANTENV